MGNKPSGGECGVGWGSGVAHAGREQEGECGVGWHTAGGER